MKTLVAILAGVLAGVLIQLAILPAVAQVTSPSGGVTYNPAVSPSHNSLSGGSAPAVTACGTSPSIDSKATDGSGTVTTGSGANTSCTVTFNVAYGTFNHCLVTPHQSDAGFAYSYTLAVITVTATSLTSEVFDYRCDGV